MAASTSASVTSGWRSLILGCTPTTLMLLPSYDMISYHIRLIRPNVYRPLPPRFAIPAALGGGSRPSSHASRRLSRCSQVVAPLTGWHHDHRSAQQVSEGHPRAEDRPTALPSVLRYAPNSAQGPRFGARAPRSVSVFRRSENSGTQRGPAASSGPAGRRPAGPIHFAKITILSFAAAAALAASSCSGPYTMTPAWQWCTQVGSFPLATRSSHRSHRCVGMGR